MAKVCQVTGKRAQSGNNVSHANNKTRRRWLPNLHERRFWVATENRWVKLRVSTNALRTIDKNGIDAAFFAGTSWRSNFLCNLGHGMAENLFPRLPRLAFEAACRMA